MSNEDVEIRHGASIIPKPTQKLLSDQQLIDYRSHRTDFIDWMHTLGKHPSKVEGYARDVIKRRANDIDRFYRWVWQEEGGYTTRITTDHADDYCRQLARDDTGPAHKKNTQLALKSLFRWRDITWDPEMTFTGETGTSMPRDYLTLDERRKAREAALEWDGSPRYGSMSPEQRSRWKQYVATRIGKPLDDVTPDDYADVDGFKYTSLIWTALDTGLRPIEVGRANTYWVDVENAVLRIPRDESSKNDGNWIVSIREGTAEFLDYWLMERELDPIYDDSDNLWLTRQGNPYNSSSLRYVMENLLDKADIKENGRSLSWYAIRHSLGTYMTREEGLGAAQSQLRHTALETTVKYDQAPIEDRRDALDKMG